LVDLGLLAPNPRTLLTYASKGWKNACPQSPGGYFISGAHVTKIVLAGFPAYGGTSKFNFTSSVSFEVSFGNSSNTSLNWIPI